jgi:hypothetical protein
MAALANIDKLVEAGLAPIKKLSYARIVMSDPRQGIYSMVYRDLATQIFTKLARYAVNDSVIYNRLQALLEADKKTKLEDFILDNEQKTLIGTDTFRKFAQSMVPGQSGKIRDATKRTLATVRKATKK